MRSLFLALAALVCAFQSASGQKIADEKLHQKVAAGIECTVRQDYAGARRYFTAASAMNPQHPAPYVYMAGAVQAQATDYGRPLERRLYDSLLTMGEHCADAMIERFPQSADGYYYAGTVLAYRAFTSS
ncbi:MAG: hypothetical protein ACM3Q4_14865, partial [Acidobacteriota bacterium]